MGKVADVSDNEARCICGGCPSDPADSILYCAKGKSAHGIYRRGCICGDCEIFKEYGLVSGYYCGDGAAGEGPQ